LIHEDADKAEAFLDHMSKVYRYLLRNNEEKLVTIETELTFIKSYFFLLKSRYKDALELEINVSADRMEQLVPPLTLQMIVENAIHQNAISRLKPLKIEITNATQGIQVINSIQPKINSVHSNAEIEENINNKYRLLCGCEILIEEDTDQRAIWLPVMKDKEKYLT
jgi:LytS/YehU family sensor histidine kinase